MKYRLLMSWLLAAMWLPGMAFGACGPHERSNSSRIRIDSESVLLVTHASSRFDARMTTKRGVDAAVRFAKTRGIPVIYLEDSNPPEYYLPDDCNPTHWVYSESGELPVNLSASHVYVVGGHLEVCLSNTLLDVLLQWSKQPKRDLTVTYFMDAIYSNGKEVADTDPWHQDFAGFMSVVTYGQTGNGDAYKISLLESIGIIVREDRQFAYLQRLIPHFPRMFNTDYRVELLHNGKSRIIQRGRSVNGPVLRFQFIGSAAERIVEANASAANH